MTSIVLTAFCGVLLHLVKGETCPSPTHLYAREFIQEIESHSLYGFTDYSPNTHACWVIEAEEGDNVFVEVDELDLESGCTEHTLDRVLIYNGENDNADLGTYLCGYDDSYLYQTSGRFAYIEFITDGSVQREGFRLHYSSEPDDSLGLIIGVAIGLLLVLAIIIALIVICVICCCKNKGKVHSSTSGQGANYRTQTYPTQQYATAGNKGGAAVMASGKATYPTAKVAPGPGAQATQSHPVDANGVPLPAVYIEP